MSNRIIRAYGAIAVAFASIGTARADTCAEGIRAYDTAVAYLAARGWPAHQSTRAQMHRQPTIGSVASADAQAKIDAEHDRAALNRARKADAVGDEAACLSALSQARRHPHRKDH